MKTHRKQCPKCVGGEMELVTQPTYVTQIKGARVEVPNAQFWRCSLCGEKSVSASELRRWESIAHAIVASSLPSAANVKSIRERLGLSVSDFAAILGVTRQTIYSWERPDS